MSRWSRPSLKWQAITDNARHYLSHLTQTFDILQLTQMLWRVRRNQRRGRRERRRGRRSSGCSGKVCVWVCARGFGLWPSSFLPSTPLSQARCEWAKKPKSGREQDRRGSQARTNKNKNDNNQQNINNDDINRKLCRRAKEGQTIFVEPGVYQVIIYSCLPNI